MNFRRLVMFKIQEVCELQMSRLFLAVGGLEFVTDEVSEQAVVSSFFFRSLMIFGPHVHAHCRRHNQESRWRKIICGSSRRFISRRMSPPRMLPRSLSRAWPRRCSARANSCTWISALSQKFMAKNTCGADALVRSRTPWSGFCSRAERPTRASAAVQRDRPTLRQAANWGWSAAARSRAEARPQARKPDPTGSDRKSAQAANNLWRCNTLRTY